MKRFSFCAFALIFWLIAFSTLFSIRVEQWMTPVVSVTAMNNNDELPLSCLQWDEEGSHLFQLEEGSDWSDGTRAREFPPDSYTLLPESISMQYGYGMEFIQYSTKEIQSGGLVMKNTARTERLSDQWLVFQDEASAPSLRQVESAEQPFMENREREKLEAERLYSLNDVTAFLGALPLLAVLPAEFLFLLGLWTASFLLSKAPRRSPRILGTNILLAGVLLATLPLLLNTISLPSSLLPRDSIVDFSHYSREFSQIFAALRSFAVDGSETASAILMQAHTALWASLGILLAGAVIGALVVLTEVRFRKSRNAAPRHAVKQV